ncbi:MAG: DUF177 domain-containing protein [Sphingomonadaceae bacterium]
MSAHEFSRPFDVRQVEGKQARIEANGAERAALAERFGLVSVERLEAEVSLSRNERAVDVTGTLRAAWVQSCAISAEDLPVSVAEAIAFRFVPARADFDPDEELEIDAEDCDEIDYEGTHIDLGEAVAQSLGLAIDPYAVGPDAEEARARLGEDEANPFAALKGLKTGD